MIDQTLENEIVRLAYDVSPIVAMKHMEDRKGSDRLQAYDDLGAYLDAYKALTGEVHPIEKHLPVRDDLIGS